MKVRLLVFRRFLNKELTDRHLEQLFSSGSTRLIKGFKGKKGCSFDAALTFDDSFNLKLSFPKPKVQKANDPAIPILRAKVAEPPVSTCKVGPCRFRGKHPHSRSGIFPENLPVGGGPLSRPLKLGNDHVSPINHIRS